MTGRTMSIESFEDWLLGFISGEGKFHRILDYFSQVLSDKGLIMPTRDWCALGAEWICTGPAGAPGGMVPE